MSAAGGPRSALSPRGHRRTSADSREKGCEAAALVLELLAGGTREWGELLGLHPAVLVAPEPGDDPVDEEGGKDVAVLLDHHRRNVRKKHPRSLVETEDQLVPLRQEADRCGRVRGRALGAAEVEERPAVLGLELDESRFELLEAGFHVSGAEAREAQQVGLRRRAEAGEVALDQKRCCGPELHVAWSEPPLRGRHVDAMVAPGSRRRDVDERRQAADPPAVAIREPGHSSV